MSLKWETAVRRSLIVEARATLPSSLERMAETTAKDHRKKLEAIVREARDKPCKDCGNKFLPCVMQFDHRDPSVKKFSIGEYRSLLPSVDRLLDELAKCDLVCANCHAVRTSEQMKAGILKPFSKRKP